MQEPRSPGRLTMLLSASDSHVRSVSSVSDRGRLLSWLLSSHSSRSFGNKRMSDGTDEIQLFRSVRRVSPVYSDKNTIGIRSSAKLSNSSCCTAPALSPSVESALPLLAYTCVPCLCHPVPCLAILCHALPSCAMPCHPLPYRALLYRAVSCCAVLGCAELCVPGMLVCRHDGFVICSMNCCRTAMFPQAWPFGTLNVACKFIKDLCQCKNL